MKSIPCGLLIAFFIQVALAAPSSNRTSDTVMVGQTVSVGDMDQFVVVFGMSPCMRNCMSEMRNGFNSSESEEDAHMKFEEACDNYLSTAECFKKCPDGDDHLFDVISAGFNFMCVEQRDAFERAMPCIRDNKKAMKEECNKKCGVPDDEHDIEGDDSPSTTDVPPQWNNSSSLFAHVGGLCDVLHCSIECGRDLLNERCDKDQHVGNLMTEVIIRPLEKNAKFLHEMSPDIDEAISRALPSQCHFIIDMKELDALRAGWEFPHVDDNHITEATTEFAPRSQLRRRRSAPNLLASSGAFASHAFTYFV